MCQLKNLLALNFLLISYSYFDAQLAIAWNKDSGLKWLPQYDRCWLGFALFASDAFDAPTTLRPFEQLDTVSS